MHLMIRFMLEQYIVFLGFILKWKTNKLKASFRIERTIFEKRLAWFCHHDEYICVHRHRWCVGMTIREIVLWPKSYYQKYTQEPVFHVKMHAINSQHSFHLSLHANEKFKLMEKKEKQQYVTQHGRRQKAPKMPIDIIISFCQTMLKASPRSERNTEMVEFKTEKL